MIKIPARLLIVDDEKDFVEMFSLRLTRQGEKVFTAFSGEEALKVLAKTRRWMWSSWISGCREWMGLRP